MCNRKFDLKSQKNIDAIVAELHHRASLVIALRDSAPWVVGVALAFALFGFVAAALLPDAVALVVAIAVTGLISVVGVFLQFWVQYRSDAGLRESSWFVLDRICGDGAEIITAREATGPFADEIQRQANERVHASDWRSATNRSRWRVVVMGVLLVVSPALLLLVHHDDWADSTMIAKDDSGSGADAGAGEADEGTGDGHSSSSGTGKDDEGNGKESRDRAGGKTEGDANKQPQDIRPDAKDPQPTLGDEGGQPKPPEKPPETPEEIEDDPFQVTPETTEGESKKIDTSRWVYDPNGEKQDAKAINGRVRKAAEDAIPRLKTTRGEQERLRRLFERLYR